MEQLPGYIGFGAYMTKTSFPYGCAILPQEQFDKCEQLSWSLFQQRNSIVYKLLVQYVSNDYNISPLWFTIKLYYVEILVQYRSTLSNVYSVRIHTNEYIHDKNKIVFHSGRNIILLSK